MDFEEFDIMSLLPLGDVVIENTEFSDADNAYFRVDGSSIYTQASVYNTYRLTNDEYLETRRNVLIPFLMMGIEGDTEAQKFYEDLRDLYYSVMPDWAKSVIGHHYVQTAKTLLPKYMSGESRAMTRHVLEHAFLRDKDTRIGCGIDVVQNYSAGLEFATLCDVKREKITGSILGSTPQDGDAFICCWRFTHDSALLTEALRRTLPLMLKCAILDDFLTFRNFDFLPSKEILLYTYDGPWELFESPEIERLQRSQLFYEGNANLIPSRQDFLSRALKSRNLESLFEQITSSSQEQVAFISSTDQAQSLPIVQSASLAQLMKESVYKAIGDYCPELNTRSYRRELIKMLAYYSDCTLPLVINEIIAGGDPLERLRTRFFKSNVNLNDEMTPIADKPSLELENDDTQSNLIDEIKVINLALDEDGDSPFLIALSELKDPLGKAAVGRLLRRFQLGYPGSPKQIRPRLYEEKIDTGPGYRIYFSKARGAPIVLLGLGSKATQDADISNAEELLLSFTESKICEV